MSKDKLIHQVAITEQGDDCPQNINILLDGNDTVGVLKNVMDALGLLQQLSSHAQNKDLSYSEQVMEPETVRGMWSMLYMSNLSLGAVIEKLESK